MNSTDNGFDAGVLKQSSDMLSKKMTDATSQTATLQAEAVDQAIWQMQQTNAMAKIKGIYTLAKTANEMT